jgi:SagB-type dehydrogenase family enzyme
MIDSAQEYHRRTSYDRARMSGHFMDWANQPHVFKTYPGLPTLPLPEFREWPEDRLSALLLGDRAEGSDTEVDPALLSCILRLTHAITAQTKHGGANFYYRSIASAGALYPFELYVAATNVSGVGDGLYHHTLGLDALTLLRSGSVLPELAGAVTFDRTSPPTVAFFLSSIFFRSSWKYRDRAYRYHLLDTGHMVENLALALAAARLPFKVHYDFADQRINRLLAFDEHRETCLAVVMAWGKNPSREGAPTPLGEADPRLLEASRVADHETDYPLIQEIHGASSRVDHAIQPPDALMDTLTSVQGATVPIQETDPRAEVMSHAAAVFQRRSSRNFVRENVTASAFATILRMLCSTSMAAAHPELVPERSVEIGLLIAGVQDVEPGFYLLDRSQQSIRRGAKGLLTEEMAHVCLDQAWLGNCSMHFLFLSNLRGLDRTCGPRGYRYAMLTAGRLGQRLYLAATAMRLGCCGIGAYYDREAAALLTLDDDSELLYLVAVGPIKKWYGRNTEP